MRKFLLSGLLGTAFWITSAQAADMVVHAKPPHVVAEHPSDPPSPGNVWIGGYQRWDGGKYGWQPGHWEMPPHAHAIWMAPRWQRREGGYVFIQGWWT
jgi:hypothetical protein